MAKTQPPPSLILPLQVKRYCAAMFTTNKKVICFKILPSKFALLERLIKALFHEDLKTYFPVPPYLTYSITLPGRYRFVPVSYWVILLTD
jgi:hypothetical protein